MTATTTIAAAMAPSSLLRSVDHDIDDEDDDSCNVGLAKLHSFLLQNKNRLDAWVEQQKAVVDAHAAQHQQVVNAQQSHIDRLHHNLVSIQTTTSSNDRRSSSLSTMEGGDDDDEEEEAVSKADEDADTTGADSSFDNDTTGATTGDETTTSPKQRDGRAPATTSTQSRRLVKERQMIETDLERVQTLTQQKEREIQDLDHCIVERRDHVMRETEWLRNFKASKTRAQTDLEKHVDKFQAMGLLFDTVVGTPVTPSMSSSSTTTATTPATLLRFAFTLLDARDPDRRFEFTLAAATEEGRGVDDKNDASDDADGLSYYELVDCDPILTGRWDDVQHLVRAFNDTEDMSSFVCRLRQLFVEEIEKQEEEKEDE